MKMPPSLRQQSARIIVFAIFGNLPLHRAINLLLVGDSVDRLTVKEWCFYCEGSGKTKEYQWGDETLKYHDLPTYICDCQARNHSVAFVQIFGSRARGPYQSNVRASAQDPYVDTAVRIPRALSLYFRKVGPPDRIIFHRLLWDYQLLYYYNSSRPTDLYIKENVDNLEQDINNNLNMIISLSLNLTHSSECCNGCTGIKWSTGSKCHDTGHIVDVGLRTAVFNTRQGWFASHARPGGPMLHAFNDAIRKIAREQNLTLYDFDNDVWSSLGYDYSVDSDPTTTPGEIGFMAPVSITCVELLESVYKIYRNSSCINLSLASNSITGHIYIYA